MSAAPRAFWGFARRRKTATLSLALLRTALFGHWSQRAQALWVLTGVGIAFVGLVAGFFAYAHAQYLADSEPNVSFMSLKGAYVLWLRDGCPRPPEPERYGLRELYSGTITNNDRVYHGVFAIRQSWGGTMVVSTTGDVLLIENSGQARLVRGARDFDL